jgi:hypothetical protein
MLTLSSALRPADLTHTRDAILEHAERIVAWSRLPAERILPLHWGLLIDQHGSPRKWVFPSRATVQRSHLINLAELDEYGIHALVSDAIGELESGAYIALCAWPDIPFATEHLRGKCLGPAITTTYNNGALRMHVGRALTALKIPERPANDSQLPACTKIRPGTLIRLNSDTAPRATDYFNLITSVSEPTTSDLGGDAYIVYVASDTRDEPLRLLLTDHWDLTGADRELVRWRKALPRTDSNRKNRKKLPLN